MDKASLLNLVEKKNFTQDQLLVWVKSLEGSSKPVKPLIHKRGDVHMHPVFIHPYILLEYKNGLWICGLLTSEEKCSEIVEKCNSRFFDNAYFTKVFFTAVEPIGRFIAVFDNVKQVNSYYKKLKEIFL